MSMPIKAYVLVVADPGKTKGVLEVVRRIEGVTESHEVMGPYDIVAEVQVENLTEVPAILGDKIRKIAGIQSTTSLVTLPD
jgi:DNA-binding Lrp family transcriptional regulator